MKTRKEISELLEKLINHELGPEEKQEILALISEDDYVKHELYLRKKIDRAIGKRDVMEFREELNSLIQKRKNKNILEEPKQGYKLQWYHAAAILIIVTGLGYLLSMISLNNNETEKQKVTIQQVDQTKSNDFNIQKKSKSDLSSESKTRTSTNTDETSHKDTQNIHSREKELLAMQFEKSDYFESFIDNFRSNQIEILSPEGSASFPAGSVILFEWAHHQEDSLFVKLFNNLEKNIFTAHVKQQFLFKEKLGPGLYYWKLESEEDLLYMNKFTIKP